MELRYLRFIKKMTQLDLMLRSGVHQSRISHFENGYAEPREDEKERIAMVLGCNQNEITWNGRDSK